MALPESCNSLVARFSELYTPIREVPALAQRVQMYITDRTGGKKLPEFLNNGATEEAKISLLNDLNSILEAKDYAKLPDTAKGQAAPTGEVPAAEPEKPKGETHRLIPTRTPDGGVAYVGVQVETPTGPLQPATPATPPPPAVEDPAAALAALLRQMMPQPPPPAAPSMTEEQVKKIVRSVLADTLEVLVGALRGAK